jgi:hypothetical protein
MPETFDTHLTKLIAAELYFLLGMHAARELLGKSYFALGPAERIAVDQTVVAHVMANFAAITPQVLKVPPSPQAAGFQVPPVAPPTLGPTKPSAE